MILPISVRPASASENEGGESSAADVLTSPASAQPSLRPSSVLTFDGCDVNLKFDANFDMSFAGPSKQNSDKIWDYLTKCCT